MADPALLAILAIFIVAVLYSSVGHGGASGYLAVLALMAVPQSEARPSALLLNVFVASIASVQFFRGGFFSWRLLWPFAAASIPMAFLGGRIALTTEVYKLLLGVVLVVAALRLAMRWTNENEPRPPSIVLALAIGGTIGLLSGLVGVGGGIFLTPILLLMNWSDTKTAAGVSAMFILVNSIAGIAGNYSQASALPTAVWLWIGAAAAGGVVGSTLGAKRFDSLTLRRVLAAVLIFAGLKLILI